jgi:hypothetical protein
MIEYEVRWDSRVGKRVISILAEHEAREFFRVCLGQKIPCALVKIERTETIEAAWEWKEC